MNEITNIKELKQRLSSTNDILKISRSLLNMANIKILCLKKKLPGLVSNIHMLSNSIAKLGGTTGEKIKVGIYSNLGFCGQFNHRELDHDIIFGSKKKRDHKFIDKIDETTQVKIINQCNNTENIEFSISHKNKLKTTVEATENQITFEGNEPYLRKQYLSYCAALALKEASYHENQERARLMNSAIETTEEQRNNLQMSMNQKRQENITNDLSIIFSSGVI